MTQVPQSYVRSGNLGNVTMILLGCVVVLEVLLALGLLPVLLATCIAFCMWWHRMFSNLTALGARDLEYTPSRAVWAFFIPFLNLVRPHYVGQEIWKASDPSLTENTDTIRRGRPGSILIGWWWTLFVLSGALDRAGATVTSCPWPLRFAPSVSFATSRDVRTSVPRSCTDSRQRLCRNVRF